MAALRGRLAIFLDAPAAGRIARLMVVPFVLGFLGAGRFAGALLFRLRWRSLSSSSSGSPSLLLSSSSDDGWSASTPLSSLSPRFRFALPVGLEGANFSGFLDTRPLRRRAAEDAGSLTSEVKTAALMLFVLERDGLLQVCGVGAAERGGTIAVDVFGVG